MRRLELRRLHPDDRSVRDEGTAFYKDGNSCRLEHGDGHLCLQGPAPHARLGGFVQSHAGKKAGGRLWDLILPEGAVMHHETGSFEAGDMVPSNCAREAASVQSGEAGSEVSSKAAILSLFNSLEQKGIRYCHWKSNIRLEATFAAAEDIDLLVDQRDAGLFHAVLLENGFKLTQSRSGTGHPGVFHALGLDEASAELVHVHAYFQIVSGDSLVKNYRLPIERLLLEQTRYLHGVRVPTPEAELVLFALRIALKHTGPIEILMANRRYRTVSRELSWLREAANAGRAEALCAAWFPSP